MESDADIKDDKYSVLERGLSEPFLKQRQGRFNGFPRTSQTALLGEQVPPDLESLDYEIIENDLLKQEWRPRTSVEVFQYIFLKWALAFLIGLFVGIIAAFVDLVTENIAGLKLRISSKLISQNRYLLAFSVVTGVNLALTLFAAALVVYIEPIAAGGGVPEVKAYLNGVDVPGFLGPKTLFVKVFGSILAVSAGLELGKEGPLIHTGSCVASLLGQGGSKRYHLTWRWLRYFKNDQDRRDLVTCGAAAGVAAAFRAPIGGVLFALEEIATWWGSALLWRTFFTTAVVAVVLKGFITYCEGGKCGFLGNDCLIMFDVSSVTFKYEFADLLPVLILGITGGIVGAVYNYLLGKTLRLYSLINRKGPIFKMLLASAVSIFTSCCILGLPWLAKCKPCPTVEMITEECPSTDSRGNFKPFNCPAGQYNDLASLLFTTNAGAIKNIFSSGTGDEFHQSSLMLYFVGIFTLALVTYGLSLPSGLFIPIILIGSTYGRSLGQLIGSFTDIDQGLCAVLGAASFLGGSMRVTVSLCVVLLELTNNLSLLPSIMFVLLISKRVADAFNNGVYDMIVHLKGFPFLEEHPEPYMKNLTAGDVITGPLVTFSGIEKVGNIVHILMNTKHNGFPVIDELPPSESPVVYGLILRSHLLVLLKRKEFQPSQALVSGELTEKFSADFAKQGSGRGFMIEDIDISEEEQDMYIDLHPFCNTSPYTVVETSSLEKAFFLFRNLGLRHLCVMPKELGSAPIVGILTRHDFMPAHIFGLHPYLRRRETKRLTAWPCLL